MIHIYTILVEINIDKNCAKTNIWLHFNIVKQRYMTHGDGAFQFVYT